MGFTLRIINAPSGATNWSAHFWSEEEGRFISPSPAPALDETWDCPYNPYGATDLRILVLDFVHARTLLDVHNLGPVNDGVDYEFNCSTRKLEVISVEPEPIVTLPWIGNIWSFVWDISDWFLSAYQEVSGWIWPFHYLQYPLYGLYRVFRDMLTPIADFWLWAADIATKIVRIFSLDQITAYFRTWIDYATDAWDWVRYAWLNVFNLIGDWWSSAKYIVLAWIDEATEGFNALRVLWDEFWKITWPQWMSKLEVLGGEVTNFFTHTLPDLLNYVKLEYWWKGKLFAVDGLIGSKLAEWFPFYDDVAEFFNDPGEFLLSRLTDWFLGKEE